MNKLLKGGSNSFYIIWISVVIFFTTFVIFPLVCIFLQPKLSDVLLVLTSERWHKAIINTFFQCVCSTTLSVFVGYVYAYAVIRGKLPFKKIFSLFPIIHLVTPPFVGGLAFILLLGRQGFITKTILGLDVSLYGFWGLLLAQVLCFFPIAYLICCQTLQGINPSLEQAARSMGANKLKIFFTITLPLSFPGILSSFLFIAVSVLSDFGNPLIIAGRYRVLAVEIYTQLTGWLNTGVSTVLGIILLVPSIVLFIFQNKLLKKNIQKIATIGGKFSNNSSFYDNKKISVLFTLFCSAIAFIIVAQFLSIILGSFQKLWSVNSAFTLNHIKGIFSYKSELFNSLSFAFISAILSTAIACVTSYITNRTSVLGYKTLDVVCQLPAAIPGSLFGLSLAIAANMIHFRGSHFLIIIAMTVSYLPFSYRACTSTIVQIKKTLDDGARSLGADRIKVLTSVILPLSIEGIFSSFVYNFVRGVGTLSAVIFLVSFNTPLSSVKILNLAEQGDWGKAAALALVLTLLTFAILGIGKLISNKFRIKIWNNN